MNKAQKSIKAIKDKNNHVTEAELLSICLEVLSRQRRKTQSL